MARQVEWLAKWSWVIVQTKLKPSKRGDQIGLRAHLVLGPDRLNLGSLLTPLVLVHAPPPQLIQPGKLYVS